MIKKNNIVFYNNFHSNSKFQKKIIGKYNFTYFPIIDVISNVLNKFPNNSRTKILDYGSGVGTLDYYFANEGCTILGVDVSTSAVRLANENAKYFNFEKNLKFYDLKHDDPLIKGKFFDLILCLEVIEHVVYDKKLLLNLSRHLNPNGFLIISTPTINSPLFRLGLTKSFDKKVGHVRRYDPVKLAKFVDSMDGIKVIEIKKVEGILRNSLFIFEPLGFFIKFIRGPITLLVSFVDGVLVKIFGESNVIIIAKKI